MKPGPEGTSLPISGCGPRDSRARITAAAAAVGEPGMGPRSIVG